MRNFLFLVFLTIIAYNVFSQDPEIEMVSAKEAYEYLKKENILDNYQLISITGIQTIMGTEVDMLEGKSNLWVFICKSNDTSDHTGHLFIPIKSGESWNYFYQQDLQYDFQQLQPLPDENWVNSTAIGNAIKDNKEFVHFLEVNENSIQMKQLNLNYGDSPLSGTNEKLTMWMAVAYIDQNNLAICYYNAQNANPILCSIPPITSVISSKLIDFLYPNPTTGKITLRNNINEKSTVLIYDNIGNVVSKFENVVPNNLILDVSSLANGEYTISILSNDKMTSQKIIIFK